MLTALCSPPADIDEQQHANGDGAIGVLSLHTSACRPPFSRLFSSFFALFLLSLFVFDFFW
jgi:hypothetical protein